MKPDSIEDEADLDLRVASGLHCVVASGRLSLGALVSHLRCVDNDHHRGEGVGFP